MTRFILLAAASMLFAAPAAAQQVVKLPSIDSMIEQSTGRPAPPPIDPAPRPRSTKKANNQATPNEPVQSIPTTVLGGEAAASAQLKEMKRLEEQHAQEQRDLVKKLQKLMKVKKYKPLKKVRFLPPNSTNL